MTVEQLSDILEHDVYVLGGPSRGGAARHRTIRATIDWSHDLLGEQEQILLRRLSVFTGRWTLEMAEEVCSGSGIDREDVLDLLAQLVDQSMVLVDARDVVARYRLLEPMRQYGLERLEAAGEATSSRPAARVHSTAWSRCNTGGDPPRVPPGHLPRPRFATPALHARAHA